MSRHRCQTGLASLSPAEYTGLLRNVYNDYYHLTSLLYYVYIDSAVIGSRLTVINQVYGGRDPIGNSSCFLLPREFPQRYFMLVILNNSTG